MTEDEFCKVLLDGAPQGDLVVHAKGDLWLHVHRLMFHWTLIEWQFPEWQGYAQRWCYASHALAVAAVEEWKARGFEGEPVGWHRDPMTGRRRPDGDPTKEYVEG